MDQSTQELPKERQQDQEVGRDESPVEAAVRRWCSAGSAHQLRPWTVQAHRARKLKDAGNTGVSNNESAGPVRREVQKEEVSQNWEIEENHRRLHKVQEYA